MSTEFINSNYTIQEKLQILADAAKYDVACTSSGSSRRGKKGELGNAEACGICHSFAADGRCISLLKILMTNHCAYDCKYCINRASNDVKRATFTPEEICELTIEFYKRNYIEGLFLSSGVLKNPSYTMEKMCETLLLLRTKYHFNGYIHVKTIPGASDELLAAAGYLADRISVNLELPKVKKLASNQFISNTYTRTEVGHPISSFYGYVIDGIFQTQGEVDSHVEQSDKAIGRWKYRDVNNEGKIDSQDRAYIGNPHPDFEYSLSSRFYYKNFDLSLYIQGSQGNDICFASKGGRDGLDFWGDYFNKSTRILNTWTPENRNAELPEINILNPNDEAGKVSSYLIEDGSYIRLKQLELGYTLPKQTLSKIGLQQCRVYLNAENLLTLTKYNNIDPEVKNGDDKNMGVDYMNNMPLARVFSIGFNLSF